jgi:beta-galactosidase
MNTQVLFNDGWTFAKTGLDAEDWLGLAFGPVDLPHDWLIWNTRNLYENGIGWYRKTFRWRKDGRRALIRFDGVYQDSTVYVNGVPVGEWKYGYSSFEHEMTDALVDGENEIVVKVVHQSPNSRWYSGAGIYRNVWLKTRGASWIETDGVYVAIRRQPDGRWLVGIDTEVSLESAAVLSHAIAHRGRVVAETSRRVEAGRSVVSRELIVGDPELWHPDEPNLYTLVTELRPADASSGAGPYERAVQRIGFRHIVMDPDEGLVVNGAKMKLNGVCEHHDLGALGAAFNQTALRRRLLLLKEMGVNAIRTAHNMPAPELMDLADEMGFFVVSEAFDMWERPKTPYDYARFFREWAAKDVWSWVRRDRNHPSLLMWSIGNEIYDTHADEKRGQELTRLLAGYVREHDPKGNAPVTIGSNYMPWPNAQKCAELVDVVGYNYGEKLYHKHHAEHPDWIIYGSETGSIVQSRGIYRFPYEASVLADDDEQCSALGNSTTSWGAKSPEACIIAERDAPFSLGQFLWTGFDYIGEPTPYHTKNSYFGQLDTATFPKDAYYIYQAAWTDRRKRPVLHLFPYWDFNPGQLIDVRAATNAPRVELRLNGRSLGAQELDHARGTKLVAWWKVPYEPGVLEAIAYDEDGNVIATAKRRSFGDPRRIRLRADKTMLVADGTDLAFVEIGMEDADGNPVENAVNRVRVDVTGAGRLVGLDNGDSTDYDPYKGVSRRLFSGKLMAIVAAGLEPGPVRVVVTSPGLEPAMLEIDAVAPAGGAPAGVSARMANREMPVETGREDEVPVRKIELVSAAGRLFDPSRREIVVEARLHPADATYRDVEWRVVNDAGIDSNLAKIEADGLVAKVTALGDGSFRLRCMSRNGTDKIRLISSLEFRAEGLGTAYKDPYGFIAGGLYDEAVGEAGNGNERGVATARDGKTVVCWRGIDFGPVGSDTITIPIFALTSEPYALQIWEGMPGEERAELLADVVYCKPTRWNVYQEETYKLSRVLKGVTSISIVTHAKMHIKGFSFMRRNRAFERNDAASCDHVYGDAFRVAGGAVEEIGNNVSLVFGGMDFGAEGASRIVVCGRSPIDRNTIHIRFAGPDGEQVQAIEFTASDGYEERVFELEPVTGTRDVTFVFLPGSRFDFGWFRFER